MTPVEFSFVLPKKTFFLQIRRYMIIKHFSAILLISCIYAVGEAFLATEFLPAGFPIAFHMLFVLNLLATWAILFFLQIPRALRPDLRVYEERRTVRIDFEGKTVTISTDNNSVGMHFSLFTKTRVSGNVLWLERGNVITLPIPVPAFPDSGVYKEFTGAVKNAIRETPRQTFRNAVPRIKSKSPWKGCLLGCGILFLVLLAAGGLGLRKVWNMWSDSVDIRECVLTEPERNGLHESFRKLEAVMEKKAPALNEKFTPPDESRRNAVAFLLKHKKIEPLEAWFDFTSGLEGSELAPDGKVVEFSESISYMIAGNMVKSPRAMHAPLLTGGINHSFGWFLKVDKSPTVVYLDEHGASFPLGSMADFARFLTEGMEKEVWTFDKGGELAADRAKYDEFLRHKRH